MSEPAWLAELNPQQRAAATHGDGPLLIIAGAGTGKTKTLAARVVCLLQRGVPADRILLLTFTRRAAQEMIRRTQAYPSASRSENAIHLNHGTELQSAPATCHAPSIWGGTFHAIANRLLRQYGRAVRLAPEFSVWDQTDAEDALNLLRQELGLHSREKRFPKKGTCLDIYSRCVNSRRPLASVLKRDFPWCVECEDGLKRLFAAYTEFKERQQALDYDDLLLFWLALMKTPDAGARIAERFDHILVDEYQDTNKLQGEILLRLAGKKRNVTVCGDDAQSIYGFRAATVRNILDFPKQFPGAAIITLEQNYRSVQPILDAANAVMGYARQRFTKNLWSNRRSDQRPALVHCLDEAQQCRFVCRQVLEHLEAGVPLRKQAVLVRTAHWSDMLEVELARRNIPFRKFGGLRFLEAAHVKDLLALLRILQNPRDEVSWCRVLHLLPGIGPAASKNILRHLAENGYRVADLNRCSVPSAARPAFEKLCLLLDELAGSRGELAWPSIVGNRDPGRSRPDVGPSSDADDPHRTGIPAQIARIREFYDPLFRDIYDHAEARARDLEQLEQIAATFGSCEEFLSELTLDPPSATSDWSGEPRKDEDWLTLSTIHSAKGCEWDAVMIIHATDGIIPSDLATGDRYEIEEERRLLYVAMTRARNWLYVCFPLRYYATKNELGDRHAFAQLTRFIPPEIRGKFEQWKLTMPQPSSDDAVAIMQQTDARAEIRAQWT
ncbi:MAG: ATP-dependent helicase [Verrucomicrobiae bacterium]|nr:ATP-dependent helicase [Verrucomicrobiae bacterium]